jgi:hypothetical protein
MITIDMIVDIVQDYIMYSPTIIYIGVGIGNGNITKTNNFLLFYMILS